VALPVSAHRLGVHRVDLIARGDQRGHPQAPVGLDPDDHLARVIGLIGDELVKAAHAVESLGESLGGYAFAILSLDLDVVMVL